MLFFKARPVVFWLCFLLVAFSACKPRVRKLYSPPHYSFSDAVTVKLDLKLREISGLVYDSVNKLFYGVHDEVGKLFVFNRDLVLLPDTITVGPNKGDYEDLAIYNGSVYVLSSPGKLIRLSRDASGRFGEPVEEATIKLPGTNDFETLYADPDRKALILICKNCSTDDKKTVSAFAFYPDSVGFVDKPVFTIDADKVRELAPVKTSKFQPSAAALHPRLKKLFILSSASNEMAVATPNGVVEAVYRLTPKMFPQPEGITFTPRGDMYITNEGVTSKPTVLKFRYNEITETEKQAGKTAGYDFTSPDEKLQLRNHLREVSGLAYMPEKNLILGENDEKGSIFTIDFRSKNDSAASKIKFGGKDDYEDIVYTPGAVYLLVSPGKIVEVNLKDSLYTTQEYEMDMPKNEFETLYMDADGKSLILLCKDCNHEKEEYRQAYRFDLASKTFSSEPVYTIQISAIRKILNDEQAMFKPSAAAISPLNGKLYIVASVGKLLVVADTKGTVEQVIRLNPSLFNQPEGMTFAPNGDLYISNEAGDLDAATLLRFVPLK